MIRAGYEVGAVPDEIAARAGAELDDVEIYLAWWCDRGCP